MDLPRLMVLRLGDGPGGWEWGWGQGWDRGGQEVLRLLEEVPLLGDGHGDDDLALPLPCSSMGTRRLLHLSLLPSLLLSLHQSRPLSGHRTSSRWVPFYKFSIRVSLVYFKCRHPVDLFLPSRRELRGRSQRNAHTFHTKDGNTICGLFLYFLQLFDHF